jgi:hypothetical protein
MVSTAIAVHLTVSQMVVQAKQEMVREVIDQAETIERANDRVGGAINHVRREWCKSVPTSDNAKKVKRRSGREKLERVRDKEADREVPRVLGFTTGRRGSLVKKKKKEREKME